jgi:hypothetical protein
MGPWSWALAGLLACARSTYAAPRLEVPAGMKATRVFQETGRIAPAGSTDRCTTMIVAPKVRG